MTNFQKDYEKAKRRVSKNDIKYTRYFIQDILVPYIKDIQSKNPNISIEELEKILKKNSFNLAATSFESNFSFDYYMQYISCKYLQSHPKVFDEIYSKYKNGELKIDKNKINNPSKNNFKDYLLHYIASADKSFEDTYNLSKKIIDNNPILKSIVDDDSLEAPEKIKKARIHINKLVSSKLDRESFMRHVNYYVLGFKSFLPQDEKFLAKELKDILAESISSTTKQLSSLNLFQKYTNIEASHFEKMNFKEFISSRKNMDITNPEILRNLPIHDLMILNSFWINRYAKELENYAEGAFTVRTLNLLPKILDNTFDSSDINRDALEETLTKCNMLKEHAEFFINKRQNDYYSGKLRKDQYTVEPEGKFITYSFEPFSRDLRSRYLSEYENTFKKLLPEGNNTIENNSMIYCRLISPVINIYDMKSEMLNALISNLQNNPDIINAGIIPDAILEDGNKIQLNPNFVGIGVDTKLTFPVREHIKLSVFKDFLVSLQNGNEYIPIYEGIQDFTFPDGKLISAQQILPFTKEQEKLLKKVVSVTPDKENKDFILHMNWLRDSSNIPDKYKSTIIDKKGRNKKSFVRKYVNLQEYTPNKPLQIYVKDQDQFIPINKTQVKMSSSNVSVYNNGGEDIEH